MYNEGADRNCKTFHINQGRKCVEQKLQKINDNEWRYDREDKKTRVALKLGQYTPPYDESMSHDFSSFSFSRMMERIMSSIVLG